MASITTLRILVIVTVAVMVSWLGHRSNSLGQCRSCCRQVTAFPVGWHATPVCEKSLPCSTSWLFQWYSSDIPVISSDHVGNILKVTDIPFQNQLSSGAATLDRCHPNPPQTDQCCPLSLTIINNSQLLFTIVGQWSNRETTITDNYEPWLSLLLAIVNKLLSTSIDDSYYWLLLIINHARLLLRIVNLTITTWH